LGLQTSQDVTDGRRSLRTFETGSSNE
jgi:hypothetical protein